MDKLVGFGDSITQEGYGNSVGYGDAVGKGEGYGDA